jgi:hypothetical protein
MMMDGIAAEEEEELDLGSLPVENEEEDGSDESDDEEEGRKVEKMKEEDVFKRFIKGLFDDNNGSGSEADLSMANTEEDEVSQCHGCSG